MKNFARLFAVAALVAVVLFASGNVASAQGRRGGFNGPRQNGPRGNGFPGPRPRGGNININNFGRRGFPLPFIPGLGFIGAGARNAQLNALARQNAFLAGQLSASQGGLGFNPNLVGLGLNVNVGGGINPLLLGGGYGGGVNPLLFGGAFPFAGQGCF